MQDSVISSCYRDGYALVIGINQYKSAPPLGYAVNDATAIAHMLTDTFGFPKQNVRLLTDKQATRASIMKNYLLLAADGTDVNDRVIVFFAGHGHTIGSRRGEVGFLVPYDGNPNYLPSLIRWDELTRNSDLIPAKHILFLMDACYGGLAITRALKAGAMRFLKDMLLRPARQVLTAGKANEVVADLGGPLPNHSVFTGHLLEGLQGKAAQTDGLITANGVMAYVYSVVGRDPSSQQTPHFGYLDGDGDLIFSAPQLSELQKDLKKDQDMLVPVPAILTLPEDGKTMSITDRTKELLSEERHRIALHDLVAEQIRKVMSATVGDNFPANSGWSKEEFIERLKKYEGISSDLCNIQALLSYWGNEAHRDTLTLGTRRLCSRAKPEGGLTIWIALRWYPALLLLYAGGIGAIAANKYENLRSLMHAVVSDPQRSSAEVILIRAVSNMRSDLGDAFKNLPGHERNYTPLSDYLFKLLQPALDDLLFLGTDYESCFDRFEVILALEQINQKIWGPPGRFGWKFERDGDSSPLHRVIAEADAQGDSWPPIKAGLFNGSAQRFKEIATAYSQDIAKLGWF
jgi:Caspase domain